MFYVLRAKHIESEHMPEAIVAWGNSRDLGLAPADKWENIADKDALLDALDKAPKLGERTPVEPEEPAPETPEQAQARLKAEAVATVRNEIQFGQELMIEFAARNRLAGRTADELDAISEKLSKVQQRLASGTLKAASKAIGALKADTLIPQPVIDEFKKRIDDYLNPPPPVLPPAPNPDPNPNPPPPNP